ncbi:hypothetical protein COU14_01855 [Candidatus Kaiserbacteria bacterium CG10_big_fil_rev_8_21_14_0_10_44_10]|uniref:Uncharacterized protein n=1 Tax=Candidatus Kaiserbacteria bacterium CG10_big_fil_rev_8_21_14_0_10_44_10 TaxID=1974606 RepID=A0A2H0UHL3_9BACT|nr:MAG: hypothetical protein COU14_01855 [Candidatus Kaiserbacteria bacterium CG10_big_fil_rev_8_21_14_0_10_44_10]
MKITENNLNAVAKLAHGPHWENGLPSVRAKLRLVVNSLIKQSSNDFPKDGKSLHTLLKKGSNTRIRKILREDEVTVEAFAFAIRDALS